MPVTYADVWEFWLRYREIAAEVDFITIHILPYWEDFPIAATSAARHVDAIRARVAAAFPEKEIFVGEFGWPSAGRMREAALPSPINQARAMHEVLMLARSSNYRINLIEAYDQPWKRQLEGTVGGHWGLFDAYRRNAKFSWGGNVSNHPYWEWQAASGAGLAAAIFAAAFVSLRRGGGTNRPTFWLRIAVIAVVSGSLIGWSIENVAQESLGAGGWLRSLGWASAALFLPILCAAALGSGAAVPAFAQVMNLRPGPGCGAVALGIGILLIILVLLALPAALALVLRPAVPRFSIRATCRGSSAAAFPRQMDVASESSGRGADHCCDNRNLGSVHRAQRGLRQLAGVLVLRRRSHRDDRRPDR